MDDCELFSTWKHKHLLISNVQENQENETFTLEDVTLSQSVNIFACKGTTIIIKGKVNAVNMREYD